MALYLFYFLAPDGSYPSFEAHELDEVQAVDACARRLLEEHPTCAAVEVWRGERSILRLERTRWAQSA